ncbi:MAG TPA: MarR family winged helix-turn-helix transcriptional regulator [Acidimicrobiales bacterium]|jgi:DNA-binding MarR family transcriptional regulator
MPKWLSDEEQQAWRAYIEATQLLFERLDRELERDAGVRQGEYEILVRLSEGDRGGMRMSELAATTLFSRSRLSHAVGRLEADGLVERRECATDRRGTLAVLTRKGRALLERAAPGHVAAVRRHLFDHLSEADVRRLARVFGGVRDALQVDGTGRRAACDDVGDGCDPAD